jgi:hypothetical protein
MKFVSGLTGGKEDGATSSEFEKHVSAIRIKKKIHE